MNFTLRRQLLWSIAVQGFGAASILAATLLLASRFGPAQQGAFSRTKSEIEFFAAFAMFGLPQALFFYVKSRRMDLKRAQRWAWASGFLAIMVGLLYGRFQHESFATNTALAIAIGMCTVHGQQRALLLTGDRTVWFNSITAMPQVMLLAGVVAIALTEAPAPAIWPLLFALAYGATVGFASIRLRAREQPRIESSIRWREIGRYGLAAWIAAALSTSAVLFVQVWVEGLAGPVGLGQFTMAMTLAQVPLIPIGYVVPLLFRYWMEQSVDRPSKRLARIISISLLFVSIAVWVAAPMGPQLGLGSGYAGVAQALAILLMGSAAEAASRILAAHANASGRPWVAAQAEGTRWLVIGGAWLVLRPQNLTTVCVVWSAGAWLSALVYLLHAREFVADAAKRSA